MALAQLLRAIAGGAAAGDEGAQDELTQAAHQLEEEGDRSPSAPAWWQARAWLASTGKGS